MVNILVVLKFDVLPTYLLYPDGFIAQTPNNLILKNLIKYFKNIWL